MVECTEQWTIVLDLVKKPAVYERPTIPANGIWFGPSGGGKTYQAEEEAIKRGASMYRIPVKQARGGWFDGYAGEEIILFDEFRGSVMPPEEFLDLLNGAVRRLAVKGGFVENRANVLFFTSPEHPINWWPKWYAKNPNNVKQVMRRLDKVFQVQEDHTVIETDVQDYNFYKIETVGLAFLFLTGRSPIMVSVINPPHVVFRA